MRARSLEKRKKYNIYIDIYSMGIVFYEIATLRYPYTVTDGDYADAHLYKPVENPTKYNSSIDPKLVSIINKMLQKPKSKRFSEWQEIIDMLSTDDLYDFIRFQELITRGSIYH